MDRNDHKKEYETQIRRRLAYYREISKMNEEIKEENEKRKRRDGDD